MEPLPLSLFIQAHSFVTENIISFTYYPLFILLKHTFKWLICQTPPFPHRPLFRAPICIFPNFIKSKRVLNEFPTHRCVLEVFRFSLALSRNWANFFPPSELISMPRLATCFYITLHSLLLPKRNCLMVWHDCKQHTCTAHMKTDAGEFFCPLYQDVLYAYAKWIFAQKNGAKKKKPASERKRKSQSNFHAMYHGGCCCGLGLNKCVTTRIQVKSHDAHTAQTMRSWEVVYVAQVIFLCVIHKMWICLLLINGMTGSKPRSVHSSSRFAGLSIHLNGTDYCSCAILANNKG